MEAVDLAREKNLILANLQDAISAGKAERKEEAELRRKRDLDLIRRKNWEPEGAKHPLKVFPKEIWSKILDNLSAAEDIKNTSETCTLFQGIMKKKYLNLCLVPEVFALKNFRRKWNDTGRQLPPELEDAQDAVKFRELRKLRLSETIEVRQVSREWRRIVDSYFEEGIREFGWGSTSGSLDFVGMMDACSVEKLGRTVNANQENELEATNLTSPRFFPRYLDLDLDHWNIRQDFQLLLFTVAPRLVKAIGDQVLRFDVNFDPYLYAPPTTISLCQAYLQLRSLIERMPTIEWLQIQFGDDGRYWFEPEEVDELQECIEANPFPKLPNLQKLKISCWVLSNSKVEALISTTILENNPQVNDFAVLLDGNLYHVGEEEVLTPVINLVNHLQIESFDLTSYPSMWPEIHTSWPLKYISLDFYTEEVNVYTYFRFLEKFPTLQNVALEFAMVKCKDPGFLRLPNLTRLTFSFNKIYFRSRTRAGIERRLRDGLKMFSVDFIYYLRKLEFFGWYNKPEFPSDNRTEEKPENVQRNEIIQFKEGTMNLHKSNIWDVIPSLKTVEVASIFRGDTKTRIFKRGSEAQVYDYRAGDANEAIDDGSGLIWDYFHWELIPESVENDSEDSNNDEAEEAGSSASDNACEQGKIAN